jgi:hypothetical protein
MSDHNFSHTKENDLHPDQPLHLIKFIVINKDATTYYSLKLRQKEQTITFKCVNYLLGNTLTLIIPKYISDNACPPQLYEVVRPKSCNIEVFDMNCNKVPVSIIASKCSCVYYLNIAIDDGMACYDDLNITFKKFEIEMIPIDCSTHKLCNYHPSRDQWKWVASAVDLQC